MENKSEISSRTKVCSRNKKKITSDFSQWSNELQIENVITLEDFEYEGKTVMMKPLKPLQSNIKSRHPHEKKLIQLKK